MNKFILVSLSVLFLCAGCSRGRPYLGTATHVPKKIIVLPEKGADPTLRPYVVNGERYYPIPDSEGFVQSGKASWYGSEFHGRRTANGEVFDMNRKTAAHKTLPLGTYVRILNLSNKKELVVRINDRGPFVKGRIIDLSRAAAREIGLIGPGVAEVKIVALGREVGTLKSPLGAKPVVEFDDMNRGEFTLQVGAFKEKDNALRLADRLKVIFNHVELSVYDDNLKRRIYRVWVSRSKTLTKAGEIERKLEAMGFEEAFIVSL